MKWRKAEETHFAVDENRDPVELQYWEMTTSVPTVVRNGDEGDGQTPFGIVVGESTVPETMRLGYLSRFLGFAYWGEKPLILEILFGFQFCILFFFFFFLLPRQSGFKICQLALFPLRDCKGIDGMQRKEKSTCWSLCCFQMNGFILFLAFLHNLILPY